MQIHKAFGRCRAAVCLLLCAVLALALAMCGCTTKKTDETIIRESVAEVLGNFNSINSDMAKRFIAEMDIQELGAVGLNTTDFMKAYSDGFTYEISDIRIDGKSAEADISVYVKSFSEFEKRFASEIESLSEKYEVEDQVSESSDSGTSSTVSSVASSGTSSGASSEALSDTSSETSSAASSLSSASNSDGSNASGADLKTSKIKVTTKEMNSMFARAIVNCLKETPVRKAAPVTVQFTNTNNTWRPSPTAMDDILTAMIGN